MRWKTFGAVAVLVVLGMTVLAVVWPARPPPPTAETLTIADSGQIMSALLYIALAEHYFADEGLEVSIQPFASGKASLAAAIEGKVDIATVAEVPFMRAVLEGQPVQVFATIQTTDKDMAIIARMDAGIKTPQDLAGKRIGTIPGTSGDYFLDLFLTINGLQGSGVIVVPFEPAEAAAALTAGSVDAMSGWTMLRLQVQEKLPNGMVSFFRDGLYTEAWTLAARKAFLHKRPEATRKLLRALLKAERLARTNRQQAGDIVARWLQLDRGKVEELWDNYGFTVSLDQALIVNLEGQARAMRQAAPPLSPPNFLHSLYFDGLAAVASHRITVLR